MKKKEQYFGIAALAFVLALTLYCAFSRQVTGGASGHVVASMILTIMMLVLLCEGYSIPLLRGYLLAIFFVSLFGIGIEFVQYFTPHRVFDVYDIFANFIGVLLGSGAYFMRYKYVLKR